MAFGIKQKNKIRQLGDARVRNLYNHHPEIVYMRGVRSILESINVYMSESQDGTSGSFIRPIPLTQSKKDLPGDPGNQEKQKRASREPSENLLKNSMFVNVLFSQKSLKTVS